LVGSVHHGIGPAVVDDVVMCVLLR